MNSFLGGTGRYSKCWIDRRRRRTRKFDEELKDGVGMESRFCVFVDAVKVLASVFSERSRRPSCNSQSRPRRAIRAEG